MDVVGGLLSGTKAQGAFMLRSMLDPPFSLRIEDHAPLTLVAMLRGGAWVIPDDEPVEINAGDVAIIRGPHPYTVADNIDTPPQIVIDEDQRCTTIDGEELYQSMALGVRTWGNSLDGETVMLTGTYTMDTEVSQRLLRTLPQVTVLRGDEWGSPLIPILEHEVIKDEPGQEVILDRLLDVLLLTAVKAWLSRSDTETPGWYAAQSHPGVGTALRSIYNNPAYPWTVAELASAARMSRAAFSRQFTDLVGEPPLTYLTNWRLTLAADLLCEPGVTIGSVADQVGYGSPYALSAAFKRVRGVSPKEHRLARRAG